MKSNDKQGSKLRDQQDIRDDLVNPVHPVKKAMEDIC